jgi:hypothetical protein
MIELEFRNVDFCGGRKTLEARERINKLNSHVTPSPVIEPEIAVVRGERLAATVLQHLMMLQHLLFYEPICG